MQCETSVDVTVTPKIQNTYYLRFVGSETETVQVKAVPTDEENPDPITTVYEITYTPK